MAQEKLAKERSPLYPVFSINESIAFVEEIVRIGGKKVSVSTVASVVGASVKTNSFKSRISTAKQFGLIRGTGGTLELTELAKRIFYKVDDRESKQDLIESFLSAPLYKKVVERYENQAIPPVDKLSNILLLEYGMTQAAKDVAASKFLESAEQIGILRNGIIMLEEDDDDLSSSIVPPTVSAPTEPAVSPEKASQTSGFAPAAETSGYCFTIPTLSGSLAQVLIPQDVTEKDLDFITLYIQNMLPTFISNLKEELEK